MKIGILTYHRAVNYGAVLQTYGLQQALKKIGKYSEIIQYSEAGIKKSYKRMFHLKKYLRLFRTLLKPILACKTKLKYRKFNNFISSRIILSKHTINSRDELKELNNFYKYFIAGSDQIWNLEINKMDTSYFLDFVIEDKKKISYAASFGKKYQESWEIDLYKKYLNGFAHISVREEYGKNILTKIGYESKVHIDPVLLHDKKFWLSEVNKDPIISGDYIVVYYIQKPSESYRIAKKIAQEKKYKLVHMGNINSGEKYDTELSHLGPLDFLNVLSNSKHIVTTSFHGLAFAIIFQKNFHYELSRDNVNTNARLEHLVKLLNLQEREISSSCEFESKDIQRWGDIENILEQERRKSYEYLNSILRD